MTALVSGGKLPINLRRRDWHQHSVASSVTAWRLDAVGADRQKLLGQRAANAADQANINSVELKLVACDRPKVAVKTARARHQLIPEALNYKHYRARINCLGSGLNRLRHQDFIFK